MVDVRIIIVYTVYTKQLIYLGVPYAMPKTSFHSECSFLIELLKIIENKS